MPQGSVEPTCTITEIFNPGNHGAPNCVFPGYTATRTAYDDCHGCARSTASLEINVVCTDVSYATDSTTTITSTACGTGYGTGKHAAQATPSPTCVKMVAGPSFNLDPTCTSYQHTVTATESIDCGGCALETRFAGFGPVSTRKTAPNKRQPELTGSKVRVCDATVTKETSTWTTTVCEPTNTSS